MPRKPLTIFLSSPMDMKTQRSRAKLVVDSLRRTYREYRYIQAYLWEEELMYAGGHFQDLITPPANVTSWC